MIAILVTVLPSTVMRKFLKDITLVFIGLNMLGTCLTATEFDTDSFKVGVAPETLRCTNLGKHTHIERGTSGY